MVRVLCKTTTTCWYSNDRTGDCGMTLILSNLRPKHPFSDLQYHAKNAHTTEITCSMSVFQSSCRVIPWYVGLLVQRYARRLLLYMHAGFPDPDSEFVLKHTFFPSIDPLL
eukprot:scaffold2043_cov166-Amphora_coffeaeformis.AAC.19